MTNIELYESCFEQANNFKEQVRKSLDCLENYQNASDLFMKASNAALVLAAEAQKKSDDCQNNRWIALAKYVESESYSCLSSYEYENRRPVTALDYANKETEALNCAISHARLAAGSKQMEQCVLIWTYFGINHKSDANAILARAAWDAKKYVEAIDHYRSAHKNAEIAREYAINNDLPEVYVRISTGNATGMLINISQALAMLTISRTQKDAKSGAYIINPHVLYNLFSYTLEAYEHAKSAYRQNPEWEQYGNGAEVALQNIVNFLVDHKKKWNSILLQFKDDVRVHKLMREIDVTLYNKTIQSISPKENKYIKIWAIGGFALLAFVVVLSGVLVLTTQLQGFWMALLAISAIEVILILLFAFIARFSGDISEKSLLAIISMAVKLQIDTFLGIFKTLSRSNTEQSQEVGE